MRDTSLLEQKKLQWAKEKEELSKLNDFFSATTTTHQFERTSIRTYYSNVDLSSSTDSSVKSSTLPRRANYYYEPYEAHNNINKKNGSRHSNRRTYTDSCCDNEFPYDTNGNHDLVHNTVRAPMLPPIGRNNRQKQMSTQTRQNRFVHPNTDEETSGYLSDRMSPWANEVQCNNQPQNPPGQGYIKDYSNYIYPSSSDELATEVDALKIDDRRRVPKHQLLTSETDDNGQETDFPIPKTPSSIDSDNRNYSRLSSCPPNRKDKEERAKWGDRSNHYYDTISKENSIKSDGPCWLERGFVDSGDESVRSYSFIRGQNAPIDPNILAERTTKRMKAMELQNAIKAQVEERERLRKIELEKSLLEERRREENLRQQIESNEQRFEEEQRKMRDKLEREQRKQDAMRIAIEKARQEAELERKKKRSACLYDNENEQKDETLKFDEYSDEIPKMMPPPKIVPPSKPDDTDEDNDDGEKILIGTPIKMRKKTLNKSSKNPISAKKEVSVQDEKEPSQTAESESNMDGIALVLQTLPPIMPILNNDIINLNQNINNLNTSNIQLAVMLAHQMQQLNNIAQTQSRSHIQLPDFIKTKLNTPDSPSQDLSSFTQNDGEKSNTAEICKQCATGREISIHEEIETPATDQTHTKDAATVTDETDNHEEFVEEISKMKNSQVSDASTQTDQKLEYCIQCRCHHCNHHHHVIVKDIKDISLNCVEDHVSSKLKCSDKECAAAGNRTNCIDSKEPQKIEDRPKWGVNRPLHQYVKASERDPFYLRNKRKKHQKRQFSEDVNRIYNDDGSKEYSMQESRSTSPNPSIITNSTVTLNSPQLINRKRSICTEILPIKTDMNGRVYLNFDEASLHVTEDEQSKHRPQKNRMINRNRTANDIEGNEGELTN